MTETTPQITDSHCHLDFPDFEGRLDEVLASAAAAGVTRMVTICTKLKNEPTVRAIAEAPDPKAVVRSLGRVPLSGHETAAEHWFSLVYERAAVLAGALAAAGGLLGEPDDE